MLVAALLVVACDELGGGDTAAATAVDRVELRAPLALTLWHAAQNVAALEALASEFNRTNPQHITVTLEAQGSYTQLYERTLLAIQSGRPPDLAVAFESFVADYMKADAVVELDAYLSSRRYGLSKESRDDIFAAYLETNRFPQFGNKLLSFPAGKSLLVMYENGEVLRELGLTSPRTWADFERVARAAKKLASDGTVSRYGWAVMADASTFAGWVLARGGALLDEDRGTVRWDGPEGLEALRLIERCVAEQWCYQPRGSDPRSDLGAGRTAFVMESSAGLASFRATMPPGAVWNVVAMPQRDPARTRTVAYGPNLAVLKRGGESAVERHLASWLFLKWLAEPSQTARWSLATGDLPVRRSAANDPGLRRAWSGDPQAKQAFDLAVTAVPEPNVRGQQDIRSTIEDAIAKVLAQRATPEDALKEAAARANHILRESQ